MSRAARTFRPRLLAVEPIAAEAVTTGEAVARLSASMAAPIEPDETSNNPRGLTISHDPRSPRDDGHACRPNVLLRCARCGQEQVRCAVSMEEIRASVGRIWRCWPCSTVGDQP